MKLGICSVIRNTLLSPVVLCRIWRWRCRRQGSEAIRTRCLDQSVCCQDGVTLTIWNSNLVFFKYLAVAVCT